MKLLFVNFKAKIKIIMINLFKYPFRRFSRANDKFSKIVIAGAGDAGSTLSKLLIKDVSIDHDDILLIDPSNNYTYQSG